MIPIFDKPHATSSKKPIYFWLSCIFFFALFKMVFLLVAEGGENENMHQADQLAKELASEMTSEGKSINNKHVRSVTVHSEHGTVIVQNVLKYGPEDTGIQRPGIDERLNKLVLPGLCEDLNHTQYLINGVNLRYEYLDNTRALITTLAVDKTTCAP